MALLTLLTPLNMMQTVQPVEPSPTDSNSYKQGVTVTVLGNTGNLIEPILFFSGWNTKADGSGTTYTPGAKILMGTANLTLYAMWSKSLALYLANPDTPNYLAIRYYDPNAAEELGTNVYNYVMTNGDEILVMERIVNGLLPVSTHSTVYIDAHSHWVSQIKGIPNNVTIEGLIDYPSGVANNPNLRQVLLAYGNQFQLVTQYQGTYYTMTLQNGTYWTGENIDFAHLYNGYYIDSDGTMYHYANGVWIPG